MNIQQIWYSMHGIYPYNNWHCCLSPPEARGKRKFHGKYILHCELIFFGLHNNAAVKQNLITFGCSFEGICFCFYVVFVFACFWQTNENTTCIFLWKCYAIHALVDSQIWVTVKLSLTKCFQSEVRFIGSSDLFENRFHAIYSTFSIMLPRRYSALSCYLFR